MIVVAITLIGLGLVISLLGIKLFRLLLPFIGLISGIMAGFTGVQAVFGEGAISTAVAVGVAVVVGVLLAILSFVFFDLAVLVYVALLGAALFTYLGVILGLNEEGFIVFMLALTGGILTAVWASKMALSIYLVVALTAFVGVGYVLAGFFLLAGNLTLNDIAQEGIIRNLIDVVDQSFLWFFVWVGAALVAMQVQLRTLLNKLLSTSFEYQPELSKTAK